MKRTALLLLTAIYLLSSLGIAANSYYCCGKLQMTTFLESQKQQQDCKMAFQMKNCCKTKKQYFKVKDQHFGAQAFSLNVNLFHIIIPSNYHLDLSLADLNIAHTVINSHGPPDWPKTPSYILNCNYRI